MKVYISGRISGLPLDTARENFKKAEELLISCGYTPVNPMEKGLNADAPWIKHILADIELLEPCDAVYFMNNWHQSVGAGIEYEIAVRTGKGILHENDFQQYEGLVHQIKKATVAATNIPFDSIVAKGRIRSAFFARMIFVYHCNLVGIDASKYINRDRTTIYHYLERYGDEYRFNKHFADKARKADEILNRNSDYTTRINRF